MEQSLQGSREQEKGVGTSRLTSQTCSFYAGVNSDGRREIIGMGIGESRAKAFWLTFLLSLKERGPAGN